MYILVLYIDLHQTFVDFSYDYAFFVVLICLVGVHFDD